VTGVVGDRVEELLDAQVGARQERLDLGHGVAAVLHVEQEVHQPRIAGPAQVAPGARLEGMVGTPAVEQLARQCHLLGQRVRAAEPPHEVLHHVHALAAVGRVDHQAQPARRREHVGERAQPGVGIGQVVEHARRDHVVEALAEGAHVLDRQPSQCQVVAHAQAVRLAACLRERRVAEIDAGDLHVGVLVGDGDGDVARPAARVEHPQPA
jgi:hypothetical protein